MTALVDTRAKAHREFMADKRAGEVVPVRAARMRRIWAADVLRSASHWKEQGNTENRRLCLNVARAHLIIARLWDKEDQKNG